MTGLNAEQLRTFDEQGYVIVDDVLDVEEAIDPVVKEYADVLDRLITRWYAEGALPESARSRYFAHLADCETYRKLVTQLPLAATVSHE